MINLVSPEQKRDIRLARTNVVLTKYIIALIAVALGVTAVYGVGFWLVSMDQQSIMAKLDEQKQSTSGFKTTEKAAKSFRDDLAVAKQVIGKQRTYSTYLNQLANNLPSGTIITTMDLGQDPALAAKNGVLIQARATDYDKTLELKSALEKTKLFDSVNIVNVIRPEDISKLNGIEKQYPYSVTMNVRPTQVANP